MPKPIRAALPTDRDLAWLAELGEVGLMHTALIVARHFHGFKDATHAERSFRRRQRHFVNDGQIVSALIPVKHGSGSSRIGVHRLTVAGADLVAALTGRRPVRAGGSAEINPVTLRHRLGVIAARLAFDDAHRLAGLPLPEVCHEFDSRPGSGPKSTNDDRFVLYESFQAAGVRHVCWPDAALRLSLPDKPNHTLIACLEYDRSTETTTQFANKVRPYDLLRRERRFNGWWPHCGEHAALRVLCICRSQERVVNLTQAIRGQAGAELFRFALEGDLRPGAILTEPIWRTVEGELRAVLRASRAELETVSQAISNCK